MMDWLKGFVKEDDDKLKESFHLSLTKAEKSWIVKQSGEECTSQNSIVRKAINMYRKSTESGQ